ncbi:MAG: 3-phosphoshikimate 1-carboxyvinyltransferase [Actinobacteria bacterium]|nr:3-phosphoshikimate 1-carboxyvinyltransferase [Actinomycetota bacterium]
MSNWSAPFRSGLTAASKPISATVTIPGSKSATNRALILAALATTPSRIRKPLSSRDTDLMVKGLQSLGCKIEQVKTDHGFDYQVIPSKLTGPTQIDVGNAGTVMRFLPPIAALATGLIHFDGDERSHQRPIGPVLGALEQLGVSVEHNNKYKLPITINGAGKIKGGTVEIDASASSQFVSALLLVAPATQEGITIKNIGPSLPSAPHIEMTIQMLEKFGAIVQRTASSWSVKPCQLIGQDLVIEPDLSNAAPFMAAAMICGGSVQVSDWPLSTTQPGDQLRSIFTKMGAKVELNASGLTITGSGKIDGIDIDLGDVGELTPSIAAVASLATTPSTLRGISHLRLHETDRLSALATEINNLGGSVIEGPGDLIIKPGKMIASQIFRSYEDHRMATAGAIIGLAVEGVIVENIETTRKTLSDFPGMWQGMLDG